jgi:glucose-6-phosphate 1-dehydrogenase
MTKINALNPFNLVIFGGDGDLAFKKLFPALYHRLKDGQVQSNSSIYVLSINDKTQEEFEEELAKHLKLHVSDLEEVWLNRLCKITTYLKADLTITTHYKELKELLSNSKLPEVIYYYSTPSSLFGKISSCLHQSGLITKKSKIVLEKPLGFDLDSFEALNTIVRQYFDEPQIYRIDHYLGKETVQNLMVLRFANQIFELAWNKQNIESIEITVAESYGVGTRKGYYDKYGALKDMVQNHLLQLLCLVAMEPPSVLNADNVRDEKLKVLKALKPFDEESINKYSVKGQYTRGEIDGTFVNSYQEDIQGYNSTTETFVALRAEVQNWRWAGVPFYLRTGKRMPRRYSEIVINFKNVPHNIFPQKAKIHRNKLIVRLQPDEHIELVQMAKIPGPGGYRYKPISLELDYSASIGKLFPDAYERLLMDVVRGNQTLFMREDELRASWIWIDSITSNWKKTNQELKLYKAGSNGPSKDILDAQHDWNSNIDIELKND